MPMRIFALSLVCVLVSVAANTPRDCNQSNAEQCTSHCGVATSLDKGGCRCDMAFNRCVCSTHGSALHIDGTCALPAVALQDTEDQVECPADNMPVRALLVMGGTESPEITSQDIKAQLPSPQFLTILRFATARAMQTQPERVSILRIKLIPASLTDKAKLGHVPSGLIFIDVEIYFCVPRQVPLPHGAAFEQVFAPASQSFAALLPSAMRLLELEDLSPPSDDDDAPKPYMWRHGVDDSSSVDAEAPIDRNPFREGLSSDVLLWLGAFVIVAVLGLSLATCKFARNRCKRSQMGSPPVFSPAVMGSPPADFNGASAPAFSAIVNAPFNVANSECLALATAAGLDPSECLAVIAGVRIEAIARGEGWLYGNIQDTGVFGYLPEACVTWGVAQP